MVIKKSEGPSYKMKRRKNDNRTTFQTLVLVSQLGLTMVVAIGMATAVGIWMDRHFGTSWITILMFVLGAIAGGQSAYHMIRKIYEPGQQEKECDISGEDHPQVKKD